MNIGEKINRALREKDISQGEFAKMMNVAPSTVSKWCSGIKNPTAAKLIKIIDMLDLVPKFFPEYEKKKDEISNDEIIKRIALIESRLNEISRPKEKV